MGLLNYSTTVTVDKTLGEIMGALAIHGAKSVLVNYDGKAQPVAISFLVATAFGDRGFRLPANVEAVYKVMQRQADRGQMPPRFAKREQASKVAWRIIRQWLDAQLAIIDVEMTTLDQVMLPYLVVGQNGRTLYEAMVERRLELPPGRE